MEKIKTVSYSVFAISALLGLDPLLVHVVEVGANLGVYHALGVGLDCISSGL